MNKIVRIQNVGDVAFPDSMDDAAISQAASKLHAQANPAGSPAPASQGEEAGSSAQQPQLSLSHVMEYLSKQSNKTSESLKALARTARVLEQNPHLARLAIAGLRSLPRVD